MTAIEPETLEPAITLEDLDYYVAPNGLFVFLGNTKDICTKVESLGFGMYYILTEEKFYPIVGSTTSLTASYRMQAFKVVSNFIGRSIAPTVELPFDTIEKEIWFALPKIPYELKEKMDSFFRAVHEKYHTESIVLLTYDSTSNDETGWGVLIPKQTNTAGDCDYEPDSIVDEKPDHVYIVGSAHSHPEMSAFASGTDHKDQADFDGVHITYGWKKNIKGGATEFHVEFTMGGTNSIVDAETVFEDHPKAPVDETELDGWLEKVSKKTYNNHIVGKGGPGSTPGFRGTGSSNNGPYNYGTTPTVEAYKVKNYPTTAPKINDNIMIAVIDEKTRACPFCVVSLLPVDTNKRRCMSCHQYVAFEGETAADLVAIRTASGIYTQDIDPVNGLIQKPVYMWHRRADGTHEYELVYSPNGGGEPGK